MKTFDYIHCHQHREMDILIHCCFEVGIYIGTDSLEDTLALPTETKQQKPMTQAMCLLGSSLEK